MNIREKQKLIILNRRWFLFGSFIWLAFLWLLALAGKSPDMVDFAIGGTSATVVINLVYRVKTKLNYDKLTKINKAGGINADR